MKKKNKLIIASIISIAIVFLAGVTIYRNSSSYFSSNSNLSSRKETERTVYSKQNEQNTDNGKSFDFEKFTGKWSIIEFTADKDTKINIKDSTKINKGKFYTVVLDSHYNIIAKKNELNENQDIDFTVPKRDKYTIRVVAKNASGSYNMKMNMNRNNLSLSYKDFYD